MPVVINDFEIVIEPPPQQQRPRGEEDERPQPEQPQPPLRPEDVTQVLEVHRERMERLRAD
jgi:hypothetical protein